VKFKRGAGKLTKLESNYGMITKKASLDRDGVTPKSEFPSVLILQHS